MTTAVVFGGQGTQRQGMGSRWRSTPSWDLVAQATDALGEPVDALLLDDPLQSTRAAQIAVVMGSLMAWHDHLRSDGTRPSVMAGHSLGQLTALIASGTFSFADGIRAVSARGAATESVARSTDGRMSAVVGIDPDRVATVCRQAGCWMACDNAPGQSVIAGRAADVDAAANSLRAAGALRVVPLDIGGAFHTPLMEPAREAWSADLVAVPLQESDVPVVSNEDAVLYRDAEGWRQRLADHLVRPVLWRSSIDAMLDHGVERFVEVGPGATLTQMIKRIRRARATGRPSG